MPVNKLISRECVSERRKGGVDRGSGCRRFSNINCYLVLASEPSRPTMLGLQLSFDDYWFNGE